MRVLSPEEVQRAMELVKKMPPPEIQELREQIEEEKKLLQFKFANPAMYPGLNIEEEAQRIANMKLRLDTLYTDWIDGKIGAA